MTRRVGRPRPETASDSADAVDRAREPPWRPASRLSRSIFNDALRSCRRRTSEQPEKFREAAGCHIEAGVEDTATALADVGQHRAQVAAALAIRSRKWPSPTAGIMNAPSCPGSAAMARRCQALIHRDANHRIVRLNGNFHIESCPGCGHQW